MGGIGSGNRIFTKPTVEDCLQLEIHRFKELGCLHDATSGVLTWACGGEKIGSIGYVTFPNGIALSFRTSATDGSEWRDVQQWIDITATPCSLGGARHWLTCPGCGRRAGALQLHRSRFMCRVCHRLPYRSQNSSRYERLAQKAQKLSARLDIFLTKPKGMHQHTYLRLLARFKNAEQSARHHLVHLAAKRGLLIDESLFNYFAE